MVAYYNENHKPTAKWLTQLINDGLIAPGDVDDQSISEVQPSDLTGYSQVHCFAGIGAWSYALRQAGWDDDQPIWTGSPPCQSFSIAGKQKGIDDERHLWPEFYRLIEAIKPPIVIGEQVSSKPALGWWDIVASDLETSGYTTGAIDLAGGCAGAYHQRQRLYWCGIRDTMGHTTGDRFSGSRKTGEVKERLQPRSEPTGELSNGSEGSGFVCTMGNSDGQQSSRCVCGCCSDGVRSTEAFSTSEGSSSAIPPIWRDPQWISCSDGKLRPAHSDIYPLSGVVGMAKESIGRELERGIINLISIGQYGATLEELKGISRGIKNSRNWGSIKSSTLAMVNGLTLGMVQSGDQLCESKIDFDDTQIERTTRLRGYGNSIVVPVAVEFVKTIMEILEC